MIEVDPMKMMFEQICSDSLVPLLRNPALLLKSANDYYRHDRTVAAEFIFLNLRKLKPYSLFLDQ